MRAEDSRTVEDIAAWLQHADRLDEIPGARVGLPTFNPLWDAAEAIRGRFGCVSEPVSDLTVPLRVLVCGSRDWADAGPIRRRLEAIPFVRSSEVPIVMHGGAEGADAIAAREARRLGMKVEKYPADWKTHGKAAGPIRNRRMLAERPHVVLAFQRNGSRGTQDTIDEARRRGIKVEVYTEAWRS